VGESPLTQVTNSNRRATTTKNNKNPVKSTGLHFLFMDVGSQEKKENAQ
jgi:hypothetical protein